MINKLKKRYVPFHVKLTAFITVFVLTLLTAVSILFYHTSSNMRREAIYKLEYSANDVSKSIDDIILNIYNVSDAFAVDDRLLEYTQGNYENNPIKKRGDILKIVNTLFASYDLLRNNEKIAAFYTKDGELFDFLDPNADEELCKEKLEELDVNNSKKLAKFFWYKAQDNFLKSERTGDIRKDTVVIGSRRVFSRLYNSYEGVHIFAIEEQTIYEKYKDLADQYSADIFIVTEDGTLLSSSDLEVLNKGSIDDEIMDKVIRQKYDRISLDNGNNLVMAKRSEVNGWVTIICTPIDNITASVDSLQRWIFWIIVCCGIFGVVVVIFLYRRFIAPVALLNNSMQKVYNGDLSAYVSFSKNNELAEMINYYNSMLKSINQNIEQRLSMEQHKKELEMEVLMNQINPHFLYNTLETIVWKSSAAGRPDIGRIAAALGRMYRLSVSRGNLFISIKNELEHVTSYIKIQESRYSGKFEFQEVIIDREAISQYYTLKIILQPIVENAINHGMVDINRVLKIRIHVDLMDSYIKIRIVDNGIGMKPEKLEEVRRSIVNGQEDTDTSSRKSTGIGMHNIHERLKIYFGISDGIRIYSKYNVGTIVEVRIPKITKEEADKRNSNKNV